jgi:hypothetical protein
MNKKKITIIAISAVIIMGILIYIFAFSPFKDAITRMPLNSALQTGRIEVMSAADEENYFTFVSADEARKMLSDAETAGHFRFLMPQFSIPSTGLKGLVIRNETIDLEGVQTKFLLISGLPAGTVIYSNSDKFGQGGISTGDDAFAWFRTKNIGEEIMTTLYAPASLLVRADKKVFLSPIDDVFREMSLGSPILSLITDVSLSEDLFPASSQVAFYISKGEDNSLAGLGNLLTKNGKIVMVER